MEALEAILTRRSTRNYKPDAVEDDRVSGTKPPPLSDMRRRWAVHTHIHKRIGTLKPAFSFYKIKRKSNE